MKNNKRKFSPGVPNHIYQITLDRGVLFYNDADCLVFITLVFVKAVLHDIHLTGLCLMVNHIHMQASARSLKELNGFERDITALYTRFYNNENKRTGPLFKTPFGSASKMDSFDMCDNILYILNNPTVKKLCLKAEEYRWNFLAYKFSRNPFSEKIIDSEISRELRLAMFIVKDSANKLKPIGYDFLNLYKDFLNDKEWNQLTDYIISTYNVIDYEWDVRLFGSVEKFMSAVHSSKGKETEIKEYSGGKTFIPYYQMSSIFKRAFSSRSVFDLGIQDTVSAVRLFIAKMNASTYHISKFLHIAPEKVDEIRKAYLDYQ